MLVLKALAAQDHAWDCSEKPAVYNLINKHQFRSLLYVSLAGSQELKAFNREQRVRGAVLLKWSQRLAA